jgi:hypothetical protein
VAALPVDVVHLEFEVTVADSPRCTFGFWLLWPGSSVGGEGLATSLLLQWTTGPMATLLDCMHDQSTLSACRFTFGGTGDYVYYRQLAPNVGAQSGATEFSVASGIYVVSGSGGRGSGSRLHVPAVPANFVADHVRLSPFGWQQLTFLALALTNWPGTLVFPGTSPAVIGTLQRRRAGAPIVPPTFDPAIDVRPSPVLEIVGRRSYAFR